jgi:dihydrofolate reductase
MRKTTAALFISLDGVTESPEEWQFDHFDDDMMAEMAAFTAGTDAILLGRVTYEEWAPYWPTSADEPFASFINDTPKHVVSTTLEKPLEWRNSTLVAGDLAEEISELKQRPGKNIAVAGSPTLVRSLFQNDLLDELTLMVHPVVAGGGKRLFEGGEDTKRLELSNSKTTRTGVSILTYRPRRRDASS